jgi:hypothetical protein
MVNIKVLMMDCNKVPVMLKIMCMELRRFLKLATKRERAKVAEVCHDSVPHLYQLAGKHRFACAPVGN